MPYGLATTPSVFQAFINDIIRDMLGKFVIIYIDDVLIYLDYLEQHADHVIKGPAETNAQYCFHQSRNMSISCILYISFVNFIYHT